MSHPNWLHASRRCNWIYMCKYDVLTHAWTGNKKKKIRELERYGGGRGPLVMKRRCGFYVCVCVCLFALSNKCRKQSWAWCKSSSTHNHQVFCVCVCICLLRSIVIREAWGTLGPLAFVLLIWCEASLKCDVYFLFSFRRLSHGNTLEFLLLSFGLLYRQACKRRNATTSKSTCLLYVRLLDTKTVGGENKLEGADLSYTANNSHRSR